MTPEEILKKYRKIAVVGVSPNPDRPSNYVTEYMIESGYDIVGVNPGQSTVLGRPCYRTLSDVPGELEVVNVFRASEHLGSIVDEAILRKAKVIWIQLGIHDDAAEERARKSGLEVVSNQCIMVAHQRYLV